MKVLLTGASGFLGKEVLKRLVARPEIHSITVVSREKTSHPDPKVRIANGDLSYAAFVDTLDDDFTDVIHLAGTCDLHKSFDERFRDNVSTTANLAGRMGQAVFHHASTFAVVDQANGRATPEGPVEDLPPTTAAFARSKAMAEEELRRSGRPCRIFRLGALVGNTRDGRVERADGPYVYLKIFHRLRHLPGISLLPLLLLPAPAPGRFPLVPVDAAAAVFEKSLFLGKPGAFADEIYGVYRDDECELTGFAREIVAWFLPGVRPVFVSMASLRAGKPGRNLLRQIPGHNLPAAGAAAEMLDFTLHPRALASRRFRHRFGDVIPRFQEWKREFFAGFERYVNGPGFTG